MHVFNQYNVVRIEKWKTLAGMIGGGVSRPMLMRLSAITPSRTQRLIRCHLCTGSD
jgi:hypothetical protein